MLRLVLPARLLPEAAPPLPRLRPLLLLPRPAVPMRQLLLLLLPAVQWPRWRIWTPTRATRLQSRASLAACPRMP